MPVDEKIKTVCDRIIKDFHPLKIILFSIKHYPNGGTTSFKLCVVMDTQDKTENEKRIYLNIDSDIPFDVLIYTPQEWGSLMTQKHSFAKRITQEGTYIYDSDAL